MQEEYVRLEQMWSSLWEKFKCPIIQNNFDRPDYRLLGNQDVSDFRGRCNFLFRLNEKLYQYASCHSDFYINDLDYLAGNYGFSKWNDSFYWHNYKYAMPLDAIPELAFSISKIIKSIFGKNKKALVLDLDNTLWGGIVGDCGVEGLAIGQETAQGQAYYAFQCYCKALLDIGVILAVNSKNDYQNAIAGLNHPDGALRPEDFVSIQANWNPKSANILAIASELTLGPDSFVFADDNPAERDIVSTQIAGISVPALASVTDYIKVLDQNGYFEVTTLSAEDRQKTQLYHAKAQAEKQLLLFENYDMYLQSLNMKAIIRPFEKIYYQRISQLTNKSNQFNLTTLRCTEDDIMDMASRPDCITLYGKLIDKFGDNGIIALIAGTIIDRSLHISLLLMSCRVLKRGMEYALFHAFVRQAQKKGIETIYGYYYPTAKNAMVKDLYGSLGFQKTAEFEDGNTTWKLSLSEYIERPTAIQVKESENE